MGLPGARHQPVASQPVTVVAEFDPAHGVRFTRHLLRGHHPRSFTIRLRTVRGSASPASYGATASYSLATRRSRNNDW